MNQFKKFEIKQILVIIFAATLATSAFSEEEESPFEKPTVGYNIDLRLGYFDQVRNPFADSGSDGSNLESNDSGKERTLGLTRARAAVWWLLPGESRLQVVIRPDATAEGEERREFDSRAGRFYRQRPKIRLLDAYFIEKQFGDQLAFSVGVYEYLITRKVAYEPLLEFGLEVQLPQRTSVAELTWRLMPILEDKQPPKPASGWVFNLLAFQGDQDRAEQRAYSEETFDTTPTANDSHYGGVFGLTRVDGHTNRFSLFVGMADNRYKEFDDDGDVTAKGKRNEVFGQIADQLTLTNFKYPTKVALEYRVSKEKWQGDAIEIEPRTHQSVSLTTSTQVGSMKWILLGGHYGTSNFADDTFADGYQVDFGYKFVMAKNLWFTLFAAEEHRQLEEDGLSIGAFKKEDGQTKKIIRRYALEIAYLFDEG